MTQDFAKPTTTRKSGASKAKNTKATTSKPKSAKSGSKRAPAKKTSRGAEISKEQVSNTAKPHRAKFIVSLVVLLGAFIYGLYFLQSIPPTINSDEIELKIKSAKQPVKTPAKEKVSENRFNFYDILPESKVTPPKVDAYKFKEKTNTGGYYYLVQTGSFRSAADAERQKATIAFQGLKANIKVIANDNGSTWHRVMTGPFYNRSTMNSALDKLVSINIQPLVKKVKKDQ